jgi:hypothetical protein
VPGGAALAPVPLALQLVRLLLDLLGGLPHRHGPGVSLAGAAHRVVAARVDDDLGQVPVLLPRQRDLRGERRVVQYPSEP